MTLRLIGLGLLVWALDFFFVLVPAALGWVNDLNAGGFVLLLVVGIGLFVAAVVSMARDQPRTFKTIGTALFVAETVRHLPHHHHHDR